MPQRFRDESFSVLKRVVRLPNPASPVFWGGVAVLALCVCTFFSAEWEERLAFTGSGMLLRDRALGEMRSVGFGDPHDGQSRPRGNPTVQVFQRLEEKKGVLSAEYGFLNFNNDPLRVSFAVSARELAAYKQEYGYAAVELDALHQWQKKALDDAYRHAVKNRFTQEQVDKQSDKIKSDYRAKYKEFLRSRGFMFLSESVMAADIPGIVKRNVKNMRPVALTLNDTAKKRGYDSEAIVAAALALVQTALLYENVPMEIGGRQTGGIYPPVEAMARGKGDCDTKSALLASILLNWDRVRLIGVEVPNHYLMGILHNPAKGDAFVEYDGLRYVLVEPAGPAWLPPGSVGPKTTALLAAGRELNIVPLAAN